MVDNRLFKINRFNEIAKNDFSLNKIFYVFDKKFPKIHKKMTEKVFSNMDWDLDKCFLPALMATDLSKDYTPKNLEEFVENTLIINSLIPLKYNKKIHIIADEILNNLSDKSLAKDIPVSELFNIKDYSVFIDFSKNITKLKYLGYDIYAIDYCMSDVIHTLSIYYYNNDVLELDVVPLAVDDFKKFDNIIDYLKALYMLLKQGYNDTLLSSIMTLISLVLYISAEEEDCYINNTKYIYKNNRYEKEKNKRFILYPDDKLKVLKIGYDTEKKIKEYNNTIIKEYNESQKRKIKAHIRKGHIHSYWVGKRNEKEKRKLIFKYLKPILVMGTKEEIEND